jgi:outer membrane protein assembly factor BamB
MKIKNILEYKLNGERNNRPGIPLISYDNVLVIFVYDKKGFTESKIQCLSIDSFSLRWEYVHPHVINNLVVSASGNLLASCMDGEVLNLGMQDGAVIWQYKTTDDNIGSISNEVNSRIVFSGIQGSQWTWCLDTNKGTELWKVKNSGHSYQPYIFENKVLNSIEHQLFCLDLSSGRTIWKASESKAYLFNPIVANNMAISPGHGLINFYNIESGKLMSTLRTGQPIGDRDSSIWRITADEDSIYFGDARGIFYCYSFPRLSSFSFLGLNCRKNAGQRWKTETKGGIESIPAFFKTAF